MNLTGTNCFSIELARIRILKGRPYTQHYFKLRIAVAEHSAEALVVVPPRVTAVLSASAETDPTQRDRHIQAIAEQGRMGWQKTSGYNARAGRRVR